MQEKEHELEFSLEDIMREFGSYSEEPEPESQEEPAAEPEAPAEPEPQPEPAPEAEPEPEPIPAEPQEIEAEAEPEAADAWNLDDIMKEFGLPSQDSPAEEAPVPQPENEDEDITIFQPSAEVPATPATMEATQAFTPVADPKMAEQTLRLDPDQLVSEAAKAAAMDGETVRFEPVEEPVPENAEPFSQNWEPHYDEPMGEYVPPEPIVFRPRSRLSELKRKLTEGPERRYYALVEEGFARQQVSIFLSLLVVILAVASIVMYQMNMVQPDRMRLLVFGEIFAMLFSALLASSRLLDGLASLFKGKFTLDTMLVLTFLICIADAAFCLREVRVPYCAAFCLEVTMSLLAEYERRNTELAQMDTLRKATRLNRVAKGPDCYDGMSGFGVCDGEVEDFMDVYNQRTKPEKTVSVYALIAFLLSGAIALLAGLRGGVSTGLQTWSAALLAATPVTFFICLSRPMAILQRRLHRVGTVICGWKGVQAMCGDAAVPLSDTDLFPAGSVKVNGVKFYSQRDPDQTIAYATAVIAAGDTCLVPLFTQLLESRNGRHLEATSFRIYENGGIGGEVCGEPVLVGTLPFMQEMGVDLPEGARVSQAVYVAVDGELCGVFAMAFGKLKGVSAGLGTLCGYRGLTPVLTTDNFLLDEGFIRGKFGVNTRRFAFPTLAQRQKIAAWRPDPEQSVPCALTTQEGLASSAFAITGARALRTACNLGTVIHMVGGIVGLLIVLALTLVGAAELLTPANLLVFELIWSIPGLLITEWTRSL